MPHLQSLDLSGPRTNPYYWQVGQQPVLDSGAAAWAQSNNANQLKQLFLANCFLADDAIAAIFESPRFGNLEILDLSHNAFSPAALEKSVIRSGRWQTLHELELADCRLNDEAIEVLTSVRNAPALRSLQLGYNSIGPQGAKALAHWPVLANVWLLGLHDNVIGDEGLIALAASRYLGRLLELDLEQDCWNSRVFTFSNHAAQVFADSKSFPRLEALFSGCVDEYHGTAYSPGFSKLALDKVRKSPWMRPAFKAACSDFSRISDYLEQKPFDEHQPLNENDFRQYPRKLDEREAEPGERGMQQVSPPRPKSKPKDDDPPFKISPLSEHHEKDDADILEGIEYRQPVRTADTSLSLELSLEDPERPLPHPVGKWLTETLTSILNVLALGSFEFSSSGSHVNDEGKTVHTDIGFTLNTMSNPQPAIELIRECLWWVGAPAATDFDDFPMNLDTEPRTTASRFVQLSVPKIIRWTIGNDRSYRIDRVPFSTEQRTGIQKILSEAQAVSQDEGWVEVTTRDGGQIRLCTQYLRDADNFDCLNILVEVATEATTELIYRLMRECALMLVPMAFAASDEVAEKLEGEWPPVLLVNSAVHLHKLLSRGPFPWWNAI